MGMTNEPSAVPEHEVERRIVPGSDRAPIPGSEKVADLTSSEQIQVTVVLRRRAELPEDLPAPISRAELAEKYGADPADVKAVTDAVTAAGAQVVSADAASRRVLVSGSAATLESLFGTKLEVATAVSRRTGNKFTYRQREGELTVPAEIGDIVTAVLGLDDRPQARTRVVVPAAAAPKSVSYTPLDLGKIYKFPSDTDGSGQTIAIIELGGGFGQDDLDAYFGSLGITGPTVTAVGVDGAQNEPGQDPNGADGEVLLDIEVVGALAPGADVLVYFAPNTDAGFLDAVSEAAHAEPDAGVDQHQLGAERGRLDRAGPQRRWTRHSPTLRRWASP